MRSRVLAAGLIVLASSVVAQADIIGFNGLSGWTYNQALSDPGTPADLPSANTIHLTNLGVSQSRSIFYNSPQGIAQFVATFTYQALNASVFGCDYGATFTIHNDPLGAHALGSTGSGMGYATNSVSGTHIADSVAVTLQLQTNSSGIWQNGAPGSGAPAVSPVSLASGNPIDVTLSYNGNLLSETLFDTVTSATYTRNFIIGDLSSIIGSPSAYIGFTASTTTGQCSGNAADQYISGFQFTTVPEPGCLTLLALGGIASLRRRRI